MTLQEYSEQMLPAVEEELQRQIARVQSQDAQSFREMLAYHMGWGDPAPNSSGGKRVRPLLCLLVVEACGSRWLRAVGPAAAIELIHNFSLVHDDIEDNSPTRRGRPTVWTRYGVPMAVNVGDALFAIATAAILDTTKHYPAAAIVSAAASLQQACIDLTRGQFLDMSYEGRLDITEEGYWPMVEGKTAALLSAATKIGAILAGADPESVQHYGVFGRSLGLAFQVQDDILGIWGDESTTGKSAASDLLERKNSLPILYGIGRKSEFARRWAASSQITDTDKESLARLLADEGAYEYCQREAGRLTEAAMSSLKLATPFGGAGEALAELAARLLQRQS